MYHYQKISQQNVTPDMAKQFLEKILILVKDQ